MTPVLLALPGVTYLLSEKLCQDPAESFFGKQRAHGGRSDNPTVKQFCDNTVSLRVQGNLFMVTVVRENFTQAKALIAPPYPRGQGVQGNKNNFATHTITTRQCTHL